MVRRVNAATERRRRALIIAHEPDGVGGEVERRLVARGFDCDTHLVTDDYDRPDHAAPWPDVSGYDLIVPMGSVRSLTNKDEIASWIHDELALLRDAHERGVPMFGVCFGGQLLADALGGSVEKAPDGEVGWYTMEPLEPAAEAGIDGWLAGPWMQWHHDRFDPPPGATLLARSDDAPQLFRIGRTLGTQFHPEVDVAHMEGFVEDTKDEYLAECGVTREGLIAATAANEDANRERCAALVDWFLNEVAFPDGV